MLQKTLRDVAEGLEVEGGNKLIVDVLRKAADSIEMKDAELWAIDAELRKAGLEPWKYKTFAECVSVLRERAEQSEKATPQ